MTATWWLVDPVLAVTVGFLAWRAVTAREPLEACVVFIGYGLLLALAWVRLGAVDVALAEAAIGAGFTGALLITTVSWLRARPPDQPPVPEPPARRPIVILRVAICAAFGGALFLVVHALPPGAPRTAALVRERLPDAAVSNPVTAVLLNFRSIDTLLEVAVMWLAAAAGWSLCPREATAATAPTPEPVSHGASTLLVPPALLLAVYLWWIGSSRPGGAFQGAALLAGAAVLLIVARRGAWLARDRWPLRLLLVAGVLVFATIGVVVALGGDHHLLAYPRPSAYPLILLIELVCMAAIGAGFGVLFAGRRLR